MPLNFLSTTSNFKLLLSSWCKSSGCNNNLTVDPISKGFEKFPVIVPSSSFYKLLGLVTFAGTKTPLFKNFTTSIELGI